MIIVLIGNVPMIKGRLVIGDTFVFVGVVVGRCLVVADVKFKLVNLQTTMVVDAVVIGYIAILAIFVAVEPSKGLGGANVAPVDDDWVLWIHGEVDFYDAVTAMGGMEVDGVCAFGIEVFSVELVPFARTDGGSGGVCVLVGGIVMQM